MCTLTKKSRKKSFTGYKVVYKKGGKYYSPATGIEYKPGPVPRIKRQPKWVSDLGHFRDIFYKLDPCHEPLMKGKTSVVELLEDIRGMRAYWDMDEKTYPIVRMTVSDGLFSGFYDWGFVARTDVIAGSHIDKIEEV